MQIYKGWLNWGVLALVMVLVLSACTVGAPAADGTAAETPAAAEAGGDEAAAEVLTGEATGTIVFAYPGEETELQMRPRMIELFQQEYPNITVEEQPVPPDGYDQQILAAIAAGSPPDVFVSGDVFVAPFIENGVARNLSPFFEADPDLSEEDFYPTVLDYFRGPDGNVYMMPDAIDVQRLYYNRDLFDAAGVAYPTDEWTWQDFKDAAAALTQGEGVDKTYGFFADSWWAVWLPYVWQNAGDILSEDGVTCTLNEPEAVEALEWFGDFIRQGYSPSPEEMAGLGMGGWDLFVTGRVAMFQSGGWDIPGFEQEAPFAWSMSTLPEGEEEATFLHLTNYVMANGTDNPDAAWAFLKFLASEEVYTLEAGEFGWGVPPRPDVAEAFVANPPPNATEMNLENVRIGQESIPYGRLPAKILNWDAFTADGVDVALEPYWNGQISAEEALANACAVAPEPVGQP